MIPQVMGANANLKLAYEVERVENVKTKRRVGMKNPDGSKGLVYKDEERVLPEAFMVYFPAGHSILVETQAELIRLGFAKAPDVVDMESGESISVGDTLSPKQIVQRATQQRGRL